MINGYFVDGLVAPLIFLPVSKMSASSIMCRFGGYTATALVIIGALGGQHLLVLMGSTPYVPVIELPLGLFNIHTALLPRVTMT